MDLSALDLLLLAIIGLAGGVAGGLVGIGGSVIMIPAMAVLFDQRGWYTQHLTQAAAMAVNVAVALPSALRHMKARAINPMLFRAMLPATLLAMIGGVLLSNLWSDEVLSALFAVFLLYVCFVNFWALARKRPEPQPDAARITPVRGATVGVAMGLAAGALGVGGGILGVPLLQWICRLDLRHAVASSSAVIGFSAAFGAIMKISTLGEHGARPHDAIVLAAVLAPTAMVGGYVGAGLTHKWPARTVRVCFALVMLLSAARMFGLI